MDYKALSSELSIRAGFGRTFQLILAFSMVSNVALAIAYATSNHTVRTVFVPPNISKTFWVEEKAVSPEYLEQMGLFIAELLLNVQPYSVDYQLNYAKQYLDPRVSGDLSRRLDAAADQTKKGNVSSYFTVSRIQIDELSRKVAIFGGLEIWYSGQRISAKSTVFLMGFSVQNGRFYFNEFRETSQNDPFAPVPPSAAAR